MWKKIKEKIISLSTDEKTVIKNIFFAFLSKGGALIISLLTIPAFISYFNNDIVLGVWYTLLSVISWIMNFDFGLGNGIRNNLVKAFTKNDRQYGKKIISSGFLANFIVSFVLFILGFIIIKNIDLYSLFNVSSDVINYDVLFTSMLIVLIGIVVKMFLTVFNSIFYALQKAYINNWIAVLVSLLQLLFVVIFRFDNLEDSLIYLSLAHSLIICVPLLLIGSIVMFTKLRNYLPSLKYISKEHLMKVFSIGGIFFWCQIMYMVITNTNEFLITYFYGPEFTSQFQIYFKITSVLSTIFVLILTPVWSIITKAQTEKNYVFIKKIYKYMKSLGIIVIICEFLLVPILQFIINIWLGDNSIKIEYVTAFAFAFYGSFYIYAGILSTIVCGLAKLKVQTICYTLGVILKLALTILLTNLAFDWSIIIWINAFVLMIYVICEIIHIDKILNFKINYEKEKEVQI